PIVAYSEDGLSLIATQIAKPIMLDAFTSAMCVEPWGRMGYVRTLIEVSADKELKQEVIMVVPIINREGISHMFKKIKIKYEWKPPLCLDCHVFGHASEQCPKCVIVKVTLAVEVNEDGFIPVTNRKSKGKGSTQNQNKNMGFKVKKLDRIMGNLDFVDNFPVAYDVFQPYRISDHAPAVLKMPSLTMQKPKPFKFFNFLIHKSNFIEVIKLLWQSNLEGYNMLKVVSNLKSLKKPLRKLLHDQGNLYERVNKLRIELGEVQKALDANPTDSNLRDEEKAGDSNSAYFHKSIKSRNSRSRIEAVMDANGNQVSADSAIHMIRDVTNEEIKAAMLSIGDDRAPGLDGYTPAFFKKGVFHRNCGPPRCAFKIDIQKAYDTVYWYFLEIILL
ncbi:hypothetical protein Tco_1009965, partial [Tanacetum coccineum]